MASVEKTAEFSVPVDKLFALIADIGRWPEFIPALTSVSNVSGSGVGTTYDWEFKLGALPKFSGKGEVIEFVSNERIGVKTEGLPSNWVYTFADQGDQSQLKLTVSYDIPGGGIASGLVSKQIEDGVDLLRGLVEA